MAFHGVLGIVALLAVAYVCSLDRRRIRWRIVVSGMALQLLIAVLCLSFPPLVAAIEAAARGVTLIIGFSAAGSRFIFGEQLLNPGGPWGFVFAVQVLPIIIFFAALMSVLYHLGIMQRIVSALAWVLRRSMGISGTEALSAAANVFVGQTEAPLCVRPYVPLMTRSQIACLMTGGFATIAGSVMGAYIQMLGGSDPEQQALFAKHFLTASLMSAPAAIVYAKLLTPEAEEPPDERSVVPLRTHETRNILDAAAVGATEGLRLAVNVAAMLLAFVSLLALLNWPLAALSEHIELFRDLRDAHGIPPITLEYLLGLIFRPLAALMGIPWGEAGAFGSLLGQQLIATEFVAYKSLAAMTQAADPALSPRSAQIAAYALCGFANLPSIAIQIGGLSAMAPQRRSDFAALGLRAMAGGAMACWTTAAIAGLFIA
ncbi:MAG: NupC/NupG family nucleoside CNT transporter [Phycisphaerales bacterium]|nr:NupC/NupG family nucleoside CNT transporter [Phycisphaerales bacterium]